MDHYAVLTAIGVDRPGLVDEVSAYVAKRGGNLEDSRMVNLHGQFAMMMLVSGGEDVIEHLARDLGELQAASAIHADLVSADMTVGGRAGRRSPTVSPPRRWTTPASCSRSPTSCASWA